MIAPTIARSLLHPTGVRPFHDLPHRIGEFVIGLCADHKTYPEQPPKTASGVVQVANHPSMADPFVVAGVVQNLPKPLALRHTFPLSCVAHPLLKLGDAVFISPGGTLSKTIEAIPKGEDIWIAPAGRCHEEALQEHEGGLGLECKTGAGVIASLTGRSLLPMAIDPSSKKVFKNMVSMAMGLGGTGLLGAACVGALCGASAAFWGVPCAAGGMLLASAIVRWEDHAVAGVRYGTPIEVRVPEGASSEERKEIARKALFEASKQINAMVCEMRKEHLPYEEPLE